jgi:hypothetical protein
VSPCAVVPSRASCSFACRYRGTPERNLPPLSFPGWRWSGPVELRGPTRSPIYCIMYCNDPQQVASSAIDAGGESLWSYYYLLGTKGARIPATIVSWNFHLLLPGCFIAAPKARIVWLFSRPRCQTSDINSCSSDEPYRLQLWPELVRVRRVGVTTKERSASPC